MYYHLKHLPPASKDQFMALRTESRDGDVAGMIFLDDAAELQIEKLNLRSSRKISASFSRARMAFRRIPLLTQPESFIQRKATCEACRSYKNGRCLTMCCGMPEPSKLWPLERRSATMLHRDERPLCPLDKWPKLQIELETSSSGEAL